MRVVGPCGREGGQLTAQVDDELVAVHPVVEYVELLADRGNGVGGGRFLRGDERVGHRGACAGDGRMRQGRSCSVACDRRSRQPWSSAMTARRDAMRSADRLRRPRRPATRRGRDIVRGARSNARPYRDFKMSQRGRWRVAGTNGNAAGSVPDPHPDLRRIAPRPAPLTRGEVVQSTCYTIWQQLFPAHMGRGRAGRVGADARRDLPRSRGGRSLASPGQSHLSITDAVRCGPARQEQIAMDQATKQASKQSLLALP